jgi:predicted RNase H-like HicB family nuclease
MTKRYLVVYAKAPDDSFSGFAPDVPGCVSVGDNLKHMREMLTEALTLHLEGTAEDGDPIPEPHTTQVDFKDEDFDGVEYFIVEHLNVEAPDHINPVQRIRRPLAASA